LKNIGLLREKAHLSQYELAKKLNVTQGAISQWEKGETLPKADKIPKIAEILNCSTDDLFADEKRA